MIKPSNTNKTQDTLPEPDADSKQRSRVLSDLIRARCQQQGGRITFSEFMDIALYQPGLGYYSGGLQKFGEQGDFITAPEVSPLFSRCVARQCAQVLSTINQANILEFGAGSGIMAADILLELEKLSTLPQQYYIIELGAELQHRQQHTIEHKAPHLLERVVWLQALPEKLSGVILANEVLDAMPVECFRVTGDEVEALFVEYNNERLQAVYSVAENTVGEAVKIIEQRRGAPLPDGYCSEFNPSINAWLQSVSKMMSEGLVLLIDYGYPVREYYHDQRRTGTLMCHYRHRAHSDPLWYPGLQDITAFVDFSAVAYAALEADFDVSGYTSQAEFLIASGLQDYHREALSDDIKQQIMLSQQTRTLTMPSEMGERFKAMALTKGFDEDLIGFGMRDLRKKL